MHVLNEKTSPQVQNISLEGKRSEILIPDHRKLTQVTTAEFSSHWFSTRFNHCILCQLNSPQHTRKKKKHDISLCTVRQSSWAGFICSSPRECFYGKGQLFPHYNVMAGCYESLPHLRMTQLHHSSLLLTHWAAYVATPLPQSPRPSCLVRGVYSPTTVKGFLHSIGK